MNAFKLLLNYKEDLFITYPFAEAMRLWNQAKTAAYRYVVKGLGFCWGDDDRKIRKLGPKLMEQAESFLKTVDAQTFIAEALDFQNKGFAYFEVSSKTEYTYRCALKKILAFGSNHQDEFPPDRIPFNLRRGYGRVGDNPVVYRPNQGPLNICFCLLAVAKFHYRHFDEDDNYAQVPLIRFIRNRINQLSKQKKTEQPVADMSKKWMELPVFRDEVLEPLRLCCRRRKNCGDMRELSAVAWSLEGYVIVGNLTYMPPRRQQEIRDLKLSLSCPIKRPANLAPGGLVHPLPPDRLIGKNRKHGFLYRDEKGIWYRDMTPESYKTGHIYGHQVLKIPNIRFSDGSSFYDYLEMWLYGYYYAPNGVLKANGSKFDPAGCYQPRIYETRALFNPDHNFVFCQQNSTNFKATNVGKFFTNLCHGLTGVRVTPHLLRDIYATYYLDQGASDALIRSLAYAMGHSVETLRKIYDRRLFRYTIAQWQTSLEHTFLKY